MLTFTLPHELRALAQAHQRQLYDLLLKEAAASVQKLAADPAWVGGTVGILAVLHTWSRTLTYHPHVHLLVTAGGLSVDGNAWIKPAHARFLMPGYTLSQIFRDRLRAALTRAGLAADLGPALWNRKWVVHVQQIGRGEQAALYLSRYIYRVALSNDRIERFQNGQITFRYTHARTRESRRMTLPVDQFIDRFLRHTLPRGFAKVRAYGLLSHSKRARRADRVQLQVFAAAARLKPLLRYAASRDFWVADIRAACIPEPAPTPTNRNRAPPAMGLGWIERDELS